MTVDAQWMLPPSMQVLESRTFGLQILSLAEVGNTVSADHLLQMATMPLERKTTALGIPYHHSVSYLFDGTDVLTQSLHSLFGLLVTGNTPQGPVHRTGLTSYPLRSPWLQPSKQGARPWQLQGFLVLARPGLSHFF